MRTTLLLAALTVAAAPLAAQGRNHREGFWFNVSLGPGSMEVTCSTCNNNQVAGASGSISMGGTLSQRFLLGGEIGGWAITVNGVDQTIGTGIFALTWYPARRGALYLKFGVGGMQYVNSNSNNGVETEDESPAFSLGAGYDIRFSRNMSIVPYINALGGARIRRHVNGVPVTVPNDLARTLVQFGVGLTLH